MKKARLYFILLWLVSLLLIVTACSDKSIDKTNQEFLEKQVSGEENTESLFNTLQFIEAFPGLPEFSRPLALFEIPNGSRWMLLVLQGGELVTFPKEGPWTKVHVVHNQVDRTKPKEGTAWNEEGCSH